ncbi:hypothetical protein BU107_13905 [Staphylococcus xylosus]|uniref:hypothetical protein n=1 Tax=Staphylococcus xylosus TaxID=1288 RepID=UPI000E68AD9D|nr:hypothetical protein [Staphylococcus xylosus]RIM84021.1 hypothetical protein BU107_13905 [Staphylococcus xylosus]
MSPEEGKEVIIEYNKIKSERDTLIDDIAVLKANISRLERENGQLSELNKQLTFEIRNYEHENKALRLQADTYFDEWQKSKLKAKAFDEIFDAVNAHYVEYPEDWMVEVLKVVRNFEQERE